MLLYVFNANPGSYYPHFLLFSISNPTSIFLIALFFKARGELQIDAILLFKLFSNPLFSINYVVFKVVVTLFLLISCEPVNFAIIIWHALIVYYKFLLSFKALHSVSAILFTKYWNCASDFFLFRVFYFKSVLFIFVRLRISLSFSSICRISLFCSYKNFVSSYFIYVIKLFKIYSNFYGIFCKVSAISC